MLSRPLENMLYLKTVFLSQSHYMIYFSKFTSCCAGSSTLPQLHPTPAMTPPWSALQVSWAIASLCSFSQALLEFTNRLYLQLSRAFHMWILRMLLEYTCFTTPCQLLPSSSADQFCIYTYPAPGKPRCPSSHCPRSPPSTQPSSLGYRAASH